MRKINISKYRKKGLDLLQHNTGEVEIERLEFRKELRCQKLGSFVLFKFFNENKEINKLYGLSEIPAYNFWQKIGAKMNKEKPTHYEISDLIGFTLIKKDLEKYIHQI